MQKIIFVLLAISFMISLKAEENPEKEEENPVKMEYMCKLEHFMKCQHHVGICLQPVSGTEEWEMALACANDYKECINVTYSACEDK